MIGIKERREELRVCLMNVDFSPEDLESSASGKLTYFTEKGLNKLLLELHNLGLVFGIEGEPPKAYSVGTIEYQKDMLKAGYTKTEPLEEKK